ncbi:MAG: PQQ-binding-like beta-propeller repeat protein [Planctomycetota bacterium]|nr:PQQ-binding-like beta-propeller repeat protein [Planctomycetota bacterium]MDA1212754.1 PQQ-binding-like beta-propeller repeat protein [Planctomycetota bacterium]
MRVFDERLDRRSFVASLPALWMLSRGSLSPVLAMEKRQIPGPTSWPSYRRGPLQQGVAGSKLPATLKQLWKFPAPDGIASTAAIVDGEVYSGMFSGDLVCLDKNDGSLIWKYRSIDNPDPKTFAPGFRSSPTVTDDAVYLGDEDGVFHAVERETGKKRWAFETGAEIVSSAAIDGDRVIFGSYDSSLYCLDCKTGEKVWDFMTQDRVNCSPAIAEGFTFVAGCDEHLRVINLKDGSEEADIPLETYLIASPAVWGDQLYVGTHNGDVLAVNWKKKTIDWRYQSGKDARPIHGSAAITKDMLVVGGQDKKVRCIDRTNGNELWTFETRGQVDSSPAIVDDRVFIGSNDGSLYELALATGKELWKEQLGRKVTAGPAIGEGVLVVGAEMSDGFLYCYG